MPPRRRYVSRRIPSFVPPVAEAAGQSALAAIREIGHAFVRADRADDVFQFVLDRVSPVVGASFASVYLVDGASEEMRLVSAHNWPARLTPWLGAVRMRLGFGPSGEAASERRMIEIPDILSDPGLEDWHEVASELGFRAVVALPLQAAHRVLGTVTFYFKEASAVAPETRTLLRIVADQMAATAEKARLQDDMRRVDAALTEATADLERQYVAVVDARRDRVDFLENVSFELRAAMTSVVSTLALLREQVSGPLNAEQRDEVADATAASDRLLELFDALLERTALQRGTLAVQPELFDPREPLRDAVRALRSRPDGVALVLEESEDAPPPLSGDRRKVTRILARLLANAIAHTEHGEVTLSVAVHDDRVEYVVRDTGVGIAPHMQLSLFDLARRAPDPARPAAGSGISLALSRGVARLLGGELTLSSTPGQGSTFTLLLPLVYTPVSRLTQNS